MKTYILITNDQKVNYFPRVEIYRNGHFSSSTTLCGYDRSHEHAIETAKENAARCSEPIIVDLWDRKYTLAHLFRFLRMFCK